MNDFPDHVEALKKTHPTLAVEVANFSGVSSVLSWMQSRGLAGTTVDIVGMDEFESDFLIRLAPEGEWIVFGIT